LLVLKRRIDDSDQDEVKAGRQAVPSDNLAEPHGEAPNVLLAEVTNHNQESENQSVCKCAKRQYCNFLPTVPIGVNQLDFIPLEFNVGNRAVHSFENQVLTSVVDKHPDPNHPKGYKGGPKPIKHGSFLDAKVVGNFEENELHLAERINFLISLVTLGNSNVVHFRLIVLERVVVYLV